MSLFGQGEANIWYFGENAGLDFSSGNPVALLDGQLNTNEGCATISNANGNLLFYTDGITVWDKTHNIMQNGNGLLGDPSSTQSGIIVPKPSEPNIYYIFAVAAQAGISGLTYSEVDLTLNGGNGSVTGVKNVLLSSPTTEKITAIEHDNGTDYWVVAHEWDNNNFISFEITDTGINTTPITSSIGAIHNDNGTGGNETIGYMKISPNGERIALAQSFENNFVEILDFNSVTGEVSNPLLINGVFFNNAAGPYGIEFSPDSSLLYVSDVDEAGSSKIHQFNITLNNATAITNSDEIIQLSNNILGGLQLAIDGKIYVAKGQENFLDVIENPNEIGAAANYINSAIDLNGRTSTFGLPPFIQSFFNVGFMVENTCLGDETLFTLDSNENITSVLWDFGDGNTSTEESPTHIYGAAGTYTVTVTVDSADASRTISTDVIITISPIATEVTDFILCDDTSNDMVEVFDLNTKIFDILNGQSNTIFDVVFFESLLDAENNQNAIPFLYSNTSNNQEIFARIYTIENIECYAVTSFNLIVSLTPEANPIPDIEFCINTNQTINLFQFNTIVLNGQSEDDNTISYHISQEEADDGINQLAQNYQLVSNPQEIFVRIEKNSNTDCYDTNSFTITLGPPLIAFEPQRLYACDDPSQDTIESFNLTSQNEMIINDQPGSYNITYHTSQEDANNGTNIISNQYTNISNPERIYARMQDAKNPFCYGTTSFLIQVLPSPDIELQETRYICTDEDITLYTETGFDEYLWSTGETTNSIVVSTPGTYTVAVTDNLIASPFTSCTSIKTITVIESNEAEIISIDIKDWTNKKNSITINAVGIGDYEYSLDGFVYQDSNLFTLLSPGKYTAYVRDKNDCGIVQEDVLLLFYPYFFTPNGDGFNDFWKVDFSECDETLDIIIFDRFGKRLKYLNPNSQGWDGTYNGIDMPSSDYWFRVIRPSIGEIYRGHFSLKR